MSKNSERDSRITHRALVIPDSHAPLVDRAAFDCVLQAIMLMRPDRVVHLGDMGEWEGANHHIFERVRKPEPTEIARGIRKDVRAICKTFLDPLDRVCSAAGVIKKDITVGNHDIWPDKFVEANPDYQDTTFDDAKGYKFDQLFDWKKRGWTLHPIGKLLQVGELRFYHGHLYNGLYHTRTHLLKMGCNIIYGHHHSVSYTAISHVDGVKGSWCLGTIKRLDSNANEWLQNRLTEWSQAFAIVDFFGKGHFTVHVCNIIYGRCSLLSHFVDGNEHRFI